VFGQFDTFQDGTTMNWREGVGSPNPPTNVSSGGPGGVGDRFLRDVSSGGFSAGSRMIMFNKVQWTGNYNGAGVDRITAQMANFGSTILNMRITLQGGPFDSRCSSTTAAQLPPDGVWRPVAFDLTPSALTIISGPDALSQILDDVAELRIVSAANGPAYEGDIIGATLGVDNIIARDIGNFVLRITGIGFANGMPQITFKTLANRTHRLERKNALTDSDWTPVANATSVAGTGNEVQVVDPEPGAANLPNRFYRAVLLPP
jgi:hypothetical protein